jgi:hypothetical protein
VLVLGACLPSGAPPIGRHLIKDRSLTGVFLSPSEQAGVPAHVLATGPLTPLDYPEAYGQQAVADLYAVADGPAAPIEGLAALVPAARGVAIPGADPTRYAVASDQEGRLLILRRQPDLIESPFSFELARHELGSGTSEGLAVLELGPTFLGGQPPFLLSPMKSQLFALRAGLGWVFGPSGRQPLWRVSDGTFIGEDFFCSGLVSEPDAQTGFGTSVLRVRPGRAPESLLTSSGQLGIHAVLGDFTPQLLLSLMTELGSRPFAVLDTARLSSTSLPAEKGPASFVSASPDGRRLLFATPLEAAEPSQRRPYRLFIYDWAQGGAVTLDADTVGQAIQGATEWRPGTSELWMLTLPDGFARWRPGPEIERFAGSPFAFPNAGGKRSWFSPDGRYWLARTAAADAADRVVWLGNADDPRAELLRLSPQGTQMSRLWQTKDGVLVEVWATHGKRNDIYLVDPAARTARMMGSAGHLVTVGGRRGLALLDWQVSRASGRLVLIDLPSGRHTPLAEDVYAVGLEAGSTAVGPEVAEPLAPGTRVAFLSRNRLESRDDGLWLAELP